MDDSVTFIIDFLSANLLNDIKLDILDHEFENIKILESSEKKVRIFIRFSSDSSLFSPSSLASNFFF